MNKWFSSAWFEVSSEVATGKESRADLHGPFTSDNRREEAIDELVEENGDYVIAIVRFDIEGESVPEVTE